MYNSCAEAEANGMSRQEWLASSKKSKPRHRVSFNGREFYECCHRGPAVEKIPCKACGGGEGKVDLHVCRLHGHCTVRRKTKYDTCQICPDRRIASTEVAFEDYMDHYSEECWVFGSGRTEYDFRNVKAIKQPMFFINNAASIAAKSNSDDLFFCALDKKQSVWLPHFRGVCLLPRNTNMHDAKGANPDHFKKADRICWYSNKRGGPIEKDREALREHATLHQGPDNFGATVIPTIHFAWYCGFDKINLVGCDGLLGGYDPRLQNLTGQTHKVGHRFQRYRKYQDMLARELGIELEYKGTPK